MQTRNPAFLFSFLFVAIVLNACTGVFNTLKSQPLQLSCKFTGGYYTILGKTKNSKILWSFGLVLDKPTNSVYFTSDDRKELIKATYGANRVQFPFQHHGDIKTILLNTETLAFQMTFENGVINSVDKGVCSAE
jgi:hypothetical protein